MRDVTQAPPVMECPPREDADAIAKWTLAAVAEGGEDGPSERVGEGSPVRRLICVTGLGAGDSRGRGGLLYNVVLSQLLGRIYADKDAQEWIIRRSRLEWTIVRPTVLTTGPRTGAYRVLADARDWRSGFISRADVADFLVQQINDASLVRKSPVLSG